MYMYSFFLFFFYRGIVFSIPVIMHSAHMFEKVWRNFRILYPRPFSSREKFLRVTIWKCQRDKYVRRDNAVA